MKKQIQKVNIKVENLKHIKDVGFLGDIYVFIKNEWKKCTDLFVDFNTFLLDSHLGGKKVVWQEFLHSKEMRDMKKNDPTYYQLNKEYYQRGILFDKFKSFSYLNACGCGIPDCAGYSNGIRIKKTKTHFIYKATLRSGYDKGILDCGRRKIKVPIKDILIIREQLKNLMKK